MSDPITDSLSPFGDDAHMEAIARQRASLASDEHLLLATWARSDAIRLAEFRAAYEGAVRAAERSLTALRRLEAEHGLAPARVP